MSEKPDKTETVEPEAPVVPEAVENAEVINEEKFDEARAKALIAKLRAAEKQGKADAAKLAKLEKEAQARADAEKSELQKAQDRADEAEKRARAAELAVMRRDAAVKTKLPEALADRIKGETPEDMEADALAIIAALPVSVAPKINPTNPGQPQTGETDAERARRLGLR